MLSLFTNGLMSMAVFILFKKLAVRIISNSNMLQLAKTAQPSQSEPQHQQTNSQLSGNGQVTKGENTAQESVSQNKIFVYMQERKLMLLLGFLAILLIGSGIAVGIVIAMQPGFQIDYQKNYRFGRVETVVTRGAPQETESGLKYQVFGTHEPSTKQKSSGRLLRAHHKHKVDTHIAFPEQGVVVSSHSNSSISVRVDPQILIPVLMQYDLALQEIVQRYASNSTANMTDFSEEINLYMRSILIQLFTASLQGDTNIDFQSKHFVYLEQDSGKLHVRHRNHHHERLLWGFSGGVAFRLGSQNPIPQIIEVSKNEIKKSPGELNTAVDDSNSNEQIETAEPSEQDADQLNSQSIQNCIPTGDTTMSCESTDPSAEPNGLTSWWNLVPSPAILW